MSSIPYILLAGFLASAAAEGPPNNIPASTPEVRPAALSVADTGDQITLKSGKVLRGVRVIHASSIQLVLEVIPAIDPLIIPAKQVTAIAYGDDEPPAPIVPAVKQAQEKPSSNVLQAVKIASELLARLDLPVTDQPVEFNQQDILNTLRSAGIMSSIPVSFGERLKAWPVDRRKVTIGIDRGVTFDQFIQETLAQAAPWLKVEYRYDSVHFDLNIE